MKNSPKNSQQQTGEVEIQQNFNNSFKKQGKLGRMNANLDNIIEVTEENYTYRLNEDTSQKLSLNQNKLVKKNMFKRSLDCFKSALPCLRSINQISLMVRQDEIINTIQKLKSDKTKYKSCLPPLSSQRKKTLVIDLDGTLLFSTFSQPEKYDFMSELPFRNSKVKIFTQLRFGVQSFLFQMSKIYQIVVYTVRKQLYTDKMIGMIDKKNWISHVLYKEKCITLNRVYHLKTLSILGRKPEDIVFFDHDPVSGILQPQNFYKIKCFNGENNDRQLIKVIPFFRELANYKSVKPVYRLYDQFQNKEIQLRFLNLTDQSSSPQEVRGGSKKRKTQNDKDISEYSTDNTQSKENTNQEMENPIEQKMKKYNHKKTNSQVQSLVKKLDEEDQSQVHEQSGCALRVRNQNQI